MLKHLSLLSLMAALALTVSCASKKKAADEATPSAEAENAQLDPNIGSKDISLDSAGSDSGKISGLVSVQFDYDASTLSTEARRQLAENAEWIKNNNKYAVQVEGHCDSRGSVEYNIALGERRAKAVKNYLVSLGIDSKRLHVISYGEERPLDARETEEAYAKNRRANFVPLPQ